MSISLAWQEEDVAKVRFSRLAVESATAVFEKPVVLDADLSDAISWIGARGSKEVRAERERVMDDIERIASLMRQRGDLEDWLSRASCVYVLHALASRARGSQACWDGSRNTRHGDRCAWPIADSTGQTCGIPRRTSCRPLPQWRAVGRATRCIG